MQVLTIGAALAYVVFWVKVFLIPFYEKRADLDKKYIGNGRLDQALTHLDSEELIPEISDLFDLVIKARRGRAKDPIGSILQDVKYVQAFDQIEKVMQQKSTLRASLSELEKFAQRLWHFSLAHIVVFGIWWISWTLFELFGIGATLGTGKLPKASAAEWETWVWTLFIVMGMLWLSTAIAAIVLFFQYGRKQDIFLGMLKSNR